MITFASVQSSLQYTQFDNIIFYYTGAAELQISKILVFESASNTECYFDVLDAYDLSQIVFMTGTGVQIPHYEIYPYGCETLGYYMGESEEENLWDSNE